MTNLSQIQASTQNPSKLKSAMSKTRDFFKRALAGTMICTSLLSPISSIAQEPSYRMPVVMSERQHVVPNRYLNKDVMPLLDEMVSQGIFSNSADALKAAHSGDLTPYLQQLLNTDTKIKVDGTNYFIQTNPSSIQGSISLMNLGWNIAPDSVDFSASPSNILTVAISPVPITTARVFASQKEIDGKTINNYAQTFSTEYSAVYTIGTGIRAKFGSDYLRYNMSIKYTFGPEVSGILTPSDLRVDIVNSGKLGPLSLNYIRFSIYGMQDIQNSKHIYTDIGVSFGGNWLRFPLLLDDVFASINPKSKFPVIQYGFQFTPNALFSEDVNQCFMSSFYALARNQGGAFPKHMEAVFGISANVLLSTKYPILIGFTGEYNTAKLGAIGFEDPKNIQFFKEQGPSGWVNISIPIF